MVSADSPSGRIGAYAVLRRAFFPLFLGAAFGVSYNLGRAEVHHG